MNKGTAFVLLPALVAGCTTVQEIKRPNGDVEYLIACGASLGWNICYDKANQVCPSGYTTLSEQAGFNRKELRIFCPMTPSPDANLNGSTLVIPPKVIHQIVTNDSEPMRLVAAPSETPARVFKPDGELMELPWQSGAI